MKYLPVQQRLGHSSERTMEDGQEEEDELEDLRKSEEIIGLRMKRSIKLKQNIGEFVDENPQIAAKLIQNWLIGEGEKNGRNGRK